MIARLDKTYYFADFLERKRFNCSFVKKNFQRMNKKMLKLRVNAIDSTFFLIKFRRK